MDAIFRLRRVVDDEAPAVAIAERCVQALHLVKAAAGGCPRIEPGGVDEVGDGYILVLDALGICVFFDWFAHFGRQRRLRSFQFQTHSATFLS